MEFNSSSKSAEPPLSTPSPNTSPRKCNLSFSFNFDVDGIESDNTTDSETTGLQIDVSEVINYQRAKKRKLIEPEETSAINEMEEEIERQLDAKAAKTNLTATNVKNILKHVITNEHVLAMVQNSVHNTEEGVIFEPKLTRSKAKELAMAQPNIPWPMTPVKKPGSSEVQALISGDFHEDSSDEEYHPDQDQQSEDDGDSQLTNSDIDSQPSTPVTQAETSTPTNQLPSTTPIDIHYDVDEGIFKIPSIPHVPTEEENIGQRTRSKLCLNETPLEHIEQAFIPPDITTDMYDCDWDMDENYRQFLTEFTQPLTHEPNTEDDPEADPEYNILEDRESELLDKEEIRDDKAVKVSKKELKDLIAELYDEMILEPQIPSVQEQQWRSKSPDVFMESVHNNLSDNPMLNLLPALSEPELPKIESFEHSNLIAIQFQQHVQLMAQHFVMTYQNPELHSQSITCKDNLDSISLLCTGENSAFNVLNLPDALVLVNDWEKKFQDEKFCTEYINKQKNEIEEACMKAKRKLGHVSKFHPEVVKLFMESRALMYPELLPHTPMRNTLKKSLKTPYLRSEENLIALGLEQFLPFQESRKRKFTDKNMILMDAAKSISEYLMPTRSPTALYSHINNQRSAPFDNPIKNYYKFTYVPSRIHCIVLDDTVRAPKDQPINLLPLVWQKMSNENNQRVFNKTGSESIVQSLLESTDNIIIDASFLSSVVNMMPNMPNLDQTPTKKLSSINQNEDETNHSLEGASTSPQLRQTTPRLAKIRSAQNMKLMTQVSAPKGSPSPSIKSRSKYESPKMSDDSCESSRGDNEDEIAELMLASTTIRKDIVNRKKAKQARELENIKRLLEAETDMGHEERITKFAASCIQRVHVTLEAANNPETLKTVIKLFTDYSDKAEDIKQMSHEEQDKFSIDFYRDLCDTLRDYPELCYDFISFLKPHQAAMIDKSEEYTMTKKMGEFINVAQIYFAKQPSRMGRVMQAIIQIATERPKPTLEFVHSVMGPILKGHSLVMDMFLQCIPCGKPPESLFLPHLFENLTCPVGPYDKSKIYNEDSPELYENIELFTPPTQEDPYGGDNCKCICHDSNTSPSKTSNADHCISCGVRYLNGRIYLQTSEGLRPAKITFSGDEEEKLENIARVSLKTSERCSPAAAAAAAAATSTGRRRKSSKNDNSIDDGLLKQFSLKNSSSPTKDNDECSSKTKRGGKSPPKYVDQRRISKSSDTSTSSTVTAHSTQSIDISPIKSKREKRAERREAKSDSKNSTSDLIKCNESRFMVPNEQEESTSKIDTPDVIDDSNKIDTSDCEMISVSDRIELKSSKSDNNDITVEEEDIDKPWSRQDDAVLLQHIQKNYSESTFISISEILGERTVEQVKKRCGILLSLLEKMA